MKLNIKIPTSLKDITLRQYKKFLKIQESVKEQKFLNAKMIEILCDVKLEKVMLLQLNDSQEIVKLLSNMFDEKPALITRFKLNGIEYGFHPELDDLTLGEYIDLDTFIGDWDNMEKAMNVLYRPVLVKLKDKYNIEEYRTETSEKLLDMPMDAAMSSIFFLWNLGLDLSTTMTNSLEEEEGNEALTQYLTSQRNGVGISQFTDSLKGILEDLKISLN
jgi:hypothetical protein|tara:strand:- start:362 stop:1015 length:654 start_codon:yes stop_codon:yes gene_type:complete